MIVGNSNMNVNDGVSNIIVGINDWASAWALDSNNYPLFPVVPGGEKQRELAYRVGINIVMYSLTGNYKNDSPIGTWYWIRANKSEMRTVDFPNIDWVNDRIREWEKIYNQ